MKADIVIHDRMSVFENKNDSVAAINRVCSESLKSSMRFMRIKARIKGVCSENIVAFFCFVLDPLRDAFE